MRLDALMKGQRGSYHKDATEAIARVDASVDDAVDLEPWTHLSVVNFGTLCHTSFSMRWKTLRFGTAIERQEGLPSLLRL